MGNPAFIRKTLNPCIGRLAATGACGLLLAVSACGGQDAGSVDAEDPIRIRYITGQSQSASYSQTFQWWAETVEERTDGAVEFEYFWDGSLVSSVDVVDELSEGTTAEMGFITPGYAPAAFPLWNAATLPFVTNNAEARMQAWYEQYADNDLLRQEFDQLGIKMLLFDPIGAASIASREPVESVDDLGGMRLRAIGLLATAFEAVGTEPVSLPAEEIYESADRGVIDGISAAPFDTLPAISADEVTPHVVDSGVGTYISTGLAVNQDLWDGLPSDIQQVMEDVSLEHRDYSVARTVELEDEACDLFTTAGGSVHALSEAEQTRFDEAGWPQVEQVWLADAVAAGLSEDEANSFLQEHIDLVDSFEAESDYVSGMARCAGGSG